MMKFFYIVDTMKHHFFPKALLMLIVLSISLHITGQVLSEQDTTTKYTLSKGWADEAVAIGYITAPSVFILTFISGVVNEWNAGYLGIPASVLILATPPVIFLGGRSVDISKKLLNTRAKLGWALYALSIIPTSFALYSYTTDWGASVPLMIASGVLGSASIVAMTSYAFARAKTARTMEGGLPEAAWNFGIAPLSGGALAMVTFRF